jgi:propionyl-CoA synthetase
LKEIYCRTFTSKFRSTFKTARLAGGLKKLGVKKGDRVVIYMPLIPEAIIAMLAVVRLGAIHSVVFGGE